MKSIFLIIVLAAHPLLAQQARWAIKPKYDSIAVFSQGVAAVKQNGKWGYASAGGKEIIPPAYDLVYPFSEGLGVIAASDHTLLAIVDKTGKQIPIKETLKIDGRFALFGDGLLLVYNGKKWGYLNAEGRLAIACKYAAAQPFSEGLAAVLFSEYWYYIDATGATAVRPNDKKIIYWAMGFHEGQAAVLYKNGMGAIDREGRELNYKFPQITPPPDAASYKKESLACKEGELYFDAKGRVASFVSKRGAKTVFMPAGSPGDLPEIRQADNSKFGLVAFDGEAVAELSLPEDTLASVFGNPADLRVVVANISSSAIENLEVKVNGKPVASIPLIEAGGKRTLSLPLDKTNEREEVETKDLLFSLSEYGLPAGEYRKTVALKNMPAIRIEIPDAPVSIRKGQASYPLNVRVVNVSSEPVRNLSVSVGNQNRLAELGSGEAKELRFDVPASVQLVQVVVKPPRAPLISKSQRIRLRIAEETQTRESPVDATGLSKQIITR
jgi:hypothetical protein